MYFVAGLMVKNEQDAILKSLQSIKEVVDEIFIYDTGSTDQTLLVIEEWSQKHKKVVRVKKGEFIDFSTSRNVMLDWIDGTATAQYILLLDAKDEFIYPSLEQLGSLLKSLPKEETAWHLQQVWENQDGYRFNYQNIRIIRPRSGWRYKGVVHEYITPTRQTLTGSIPNDFYIFQDRRGEAEKSLKRFPRDAQLLEKCVQENPDDSRAWFYLGQTYYSIGKYEQAFKAYAKRGKMVDASFKEETAVACFYAGKILLRFYTKRELLLQDYIDAEYRQFLEDEIGEFFKNVEFGSVLEWFHTAFEIYPRIDPLVELAQHYRYKNSFHLAFMYIRQACSSTPKTQLFTEEGLYTYKRWHLMGIIGYYVDEQEMGKLGCQKAIQAKNLPIDHHNLSFYS